MSLEIERKFLTASEAWRDEVRAPGLLYRQSYLLAENGRTVRVRQAGESAWLTIKGPTIGISRAEFEYPIPVADAVEMLATLCPGGVVEKTRHLVWLEGFCFEVDEFAGENAGLIIVEIELPVPEAVFPRPAWLGREVTGERRYYNSHLARHPYRSWGGG